MLGDVGPHSDAEYVGEQSQSVFSMDYYRNKAREFQDVLNRVDEAARNAERIIQLDIDPDLTNDMYGLLAEYDAKKWQFRTTAEAINAGAAIINAAGGRFPNLSIPSGLGFVPALPVAAVSAIAVAATLITWGVQWIGGVNDRLKIAAVAEAASKPDTPDDVRHELMAIYGRTEELASSASASPLAHLAGIAKWGAIAFLAFTAFRSMQTAKETD